jgi:hypothetical protein
MLGLKASKEVRQRLRSLRHSNPELFTTITVSVNADRDGQPVGAAFRLTDGRTAHLMSFYDFNAGTDFIVVWVPDESDGEPAVLIIEAAHN